MSRIGCTLVQAGGKYTVVACEAAVPISAEHWKRLHKASTATLFGLTFSPNAPSNNAPVRYFVGRLTTYSETGASLLDEVMRFLRSHSFDPVQREKVSARMQYILDSA